MPGRNLQFWDSSHHLVECYQFWDHDEWCEVKNLHEDKEDLEQCLLWFCNAFANPNMHVLRDLDYSLNYESIEKGQIQLYLRIHATYKILWINLEFMGELQPYQI